jgi:hypothetical protein
MVMLKKDNNAGFTEVYERPIGLHGGMTDGNGLLRKDWNPPEPPKLIAYRFQSDNVLSESISLRKFDSIMQVQNETPVAMMRYNSKTWWMFQSEFYWTDIDLKSEDVKALILAPEIRKKRKIEREIEKAKAILSQDIYIQSDDRQPIPDDVKMFVWQRDKGRCVKCGSNQNLEYDHIIPVSMGGSNTARNLQILCEFCNRSKGGNLF